MRTQTRFAASEGTTESRPMLPMSRGEAKGLDQGLRWWEHTVAPWYDRMGATVSEALLVRIMVNDLRDIRDSELAANRHAR